MAWMKDLIRLCRICCANTFRIKKRIGIHIWTRVYAYNTSRQESTLYTPFEVMFGRRPVLPIELDVDNQSAAELLEDSSSGMPESTIEGLTSHRQDLLEKVKSNIIRAQKKQKEHYDKKHSSSTVFKSGVRVLKKDFTRKKRKGGKLDPKWLGPYLIVKDLGKGFYKLRSVESPGTFVDRVNGSHLKLYQELTR